MTDQLRIADSEPGVLVAESQGLVAASGAGDAAVGVTAGGEGDGAAPGGEMLPGRARRALNVQPPPRPAEAGNDRSVTHGAYSQRVGPRAEEIAAELRDIVPAYRVSDEPTIRAMAVACARLERLAVDLESPTAKVRERTSIDARAWTGVIFRGADHLALSPAARARIGLDVARAEGALLTVRRLAELVDEESRS